MIRPEIGRTPWLERLLIFYARHFPIDTGKVRVINAVWRRASGKSGSQRIAKLVHGGFRMRCDLNDQLHRQFYFFGTYFLEKEILECWVRQAKDSRVVLDVGSNAGVFSLATLAASPDAQVHAFEPTPEIAEGLRRTALENNLANLHVHQVAVSDTTGTAVLVRWRGADNSNSGMNFIVPGETADGEPTPTETLDDFCAMNGIQFVDLLKIDIQGNEHLALAGAATLLGGNRIGMIFCELNWAATGEQNCPATQTVALLDAAGYRFARPGKVLVWRHSGAWLRDLTDVVAANRTGIESA